MKLILAPTDFSPVSLNAVNYAADLGVAMNADLYLVHIFQLPVIFSEIPVATENIDDLIKDAEERIEELKKDIAKRTEGRIKIHAEVKTESVISGIKSLCETVKPQYIVMGTQGTGALERFLLGSNTMAVMKKLSWPLIVVPPEARFTNIKKIGLACDLKNVAEIIPTAEIKDLVKQFRAELHVIHVNRENEKVYGPAIIEESGLLQEMLDELHPAYHFLNNVKIDEGISEYAEKNKLDLLILIPKKHNLVDAVFHKSHTKQLMLHTHVPVMAVHE
jgi:nucleotide-binding universal stress UspA family protein